MTWRESTPGVFRVREGCKEQFKIGRAGAGRRVLWIGLRRELLGREEAAICRTNEGDRLANLHKVLPSAPGIEILGTRSRRTFDVRGPLPLRRYCRSAGMSFSWDASDWPATNAMLDSDLSRKCRSTTGWSIRCEPTPGRSATTVMPCSRRCSAGPTPDSIRMWGVCTAPALCRRVEYQRWVCGRIRRLGTYESTTSFLAVTRNVSPLGCVNSAPTARGVAPEVSKSTRVTCACVTTFRLGLRTTSGVRYANSVVTRLPLELMNVTVGPVRKSSQKAGPLTTYSPEER